MSIATWCYIAVYHDHQILAISINRFFNMTNDTVITATLMSQFGKDGLSSLVYSMMNTIGNLATVVFAWVAGRFLDATGESLECWSWIFHTMAALNVLLFIVYTSCLDSESVVIKKTAQPDENAA